jgi:membrane associated rhomboid family serine protease
VGYVIWLVLLGIVVPIAYSLLRRWYVSLALSVACAIATLLFFLTVMGDLVSSGLGSGDYVSMIYSPIYLAEGSHIETLFFSIFVHANLMHIAFNVIGLVMFGMMLEEKVGGPRALAVFLIGAVGGELVFSLFYWDQPIYLVGASGGIMAMVGAFARLYPYEKVSVLGLFIFMRNAPAWAMALAFVSIDIVLALITTNVEISGFVGQVAFLAHVGGLLTGFAIAPLLSKVKVQERVEEIDVEAVKRVIPDEKESADVVRSVSGEREREVLDAWLARIERLARCPRCKGTMTLHGTRLKCKKGHIVRISK